MEGIKQALKNRFRDGYRFNNSNYWKHYYSNKLINKDFDREKRYAYFLSHLLSRGANLLDVASGYGFLPVELEKQGMKVVCSDVFDEMILLAKGYFKKNNSSIKFIKSDVVNLPFKKASFDAVTAISIFEHLTLGESSRHFIPSLKRIVKKNGYIMIHVPVKSILTVIKKFYRKSIKHDLPSWAIDDDGDVTHKIWFSVRDYHSILLNLGLKPKFITYNFIRSNESVFFVKFINKVVSGLDGKFYKLDNSNSIHKIKHRIYSFLAVSCAFVCQKS